MKKWLKCTLISVAGCTIILFGGLWFLFSLVIENHFDDKLFDKIEWKKYSNDMNRDNPRGQMIEDLFENHLKKGMSSVEIIALLGTPDIKNEKNFYSYNLGMWSGLRMDYDSLDLWFDNKGRLKSFGRVQH